MRNLPELLPYYLFYFYCYLFHKDSQLNSLKAELTALKGTRAKSDQTITDLLDEVQQQKDQNALLKVQKGATTWDLIAELPNLT